MSAKALLGIQHIGTQQNPKAKINSFYTDIRIQLYISTGVIGSLTLEKSDVIIFCLYQYHHIKDHKGWL